MLEQPWTSLPFSKNGILALPVYDMIEGDFTGEVCDLDHSHFNNPLRRDRVSKVFHYFNMKGKMRTKLAKTKGDVAGSGKKPAP